MRSPATQRRPAGITSRGANRDGSGTPSRRGARAVTAVALHHAVSGPEDAPVLLLGGSLGTNLGMWEPQVRELSRRFRVVAFDQRGHGRSPSPPAPYAISDLGEDVLALMDQLG